MDIKLTLDLLLCVCVFMFVLLPRFNKWPESEMGRFHGAPKDYIHDRLYVLYCAIYLATFAVFTFTLSRIENIQVIIKEFTVGKSMESAIDTVHSLFGEQSFSFFLLIVLGLLAIPQVSAIDQRWRGTLLRLARIPKDSINLKQQLTESLKYSEFDNSRMQSVLENVSQLGQGAFWQQVISADENGCENPLCRRLLKALYVAALNRTIAMPFQDAKDLDAYESRLLEIAAVLPKLATDPDSLPMHEYKKDIDERVSSLLELLAKNLVKTYPEKNKRYSKLQQYGFDLDYMDDKKLGLVKPVAIVVMSLLACVTLTVMFALLLFDATAIYKGGTDPWFELDRILRWSFAGWVSYSIAVAFGLFFNESMNKELGNKSVAMYLLAFVFAALGSTVFFILARKSFQPPHVWLAISFGLLAVVAVNSRNRDYLDRSSVFRRASQLAIGYGIVSAILQVAVHMAFRKMSELSVISISAFFLFGFIRGTLVAFVVGYVFMEYERLNSYDARRKFPRIPYRKRVDGAIAGSPTEVFVKDLSEKGALMRLASGVPAAEGSDVALSFHFANVEGRIIAIKNNVARVKFHSEATELAPLQHYINKKVAA